MKYIYLLIILLPFKNYGQDSVAYTLRIMLNETEAFPLKVLNENTEELVETDQAGYFSMRLSAGDRILILENDYCSLDYKIKSNDLTQSIIRIYPESKSTVLEEVEISQISAKSLGIDSKTIMANTYNPNPNMDFKAMFLWLISKMKRKQKLEIVLRKPHEKNPYVASLCRSIITDYLKIPGNQVEAFYYFMNDDYLIDTYIQQQDEAQWKMHLLEKSIEFLNQSSSSSER